MNTDTSSLDRTISTRPAGSCSSAPTIPPAPSWPVFPGKRYEDWKLADPAGKGVDAVRPIRDEIKARIEVLLADLIP